MRRAVFVIIWPPKASAKPLPKKSVVFSGNLQARQKMQALYDFAKKIPFSRSSQSIKRKCVEVYQFGLVRLES